MSRKIVRVLGIARGSVEFDDGDKWEGEFVDGKPAGQGKHTFANGNVYEGGWEDGKPYGFGKMEYSDGRYEYYEGDWVNGKSHGNGTLQLRNGDVCVGEFQRGKCHGNGKYKWTNPDEEYEGEFANGARNGNGKYTFRNGNIYAGEWMNDEKHGRGTYKYANGRFESYAGEWLDNKPHGSGILTRADGEQLKLEYKHGQLLSSKRVATLTNGPPSQRPRIGNAVNDMFMLNEEYTTCDICMERFSFDRNTEDEDSKQHLPVLSKTCDPLVLPRMCPERADETCRSRRGRGISDVDPLHEVQEGG